MLVGGLKMSSTTGRALSRAGEDLRLVGKQVLSESQYESLRESLSRILNYGLDNCPELEQLLDATLS